MSSCTDETARNNAYIGFLVGLSLASGRASFTASDSFLDGLIANNVTNPFWAKRYIDIVSPILRVADEVSEYEDIVPLVVEVATRVRAKYSDQLLDMVDDEHVSLGEEVS